MEIVLPDPALVLLIGASGSGKSTFARKHFRATEVLSSDFCRALVCDDEGDQTATDDAFELLHLILAKRLMRKRSAVIDATNVQEFARASLIKAAKHQGVPVVAIVFALPEDICQLRNQQREYRRVPSEAIHKQVESLEESMQHLATEGFELVVIFRTAEEGRTASVIRSAVRSTAQ